MRFLNKDIKPEKVTMWINMAGFVASLIFYLNVEHSFIKPPDPPRNPLQDTLFKIDLKLTGEVKELKEQQQRFLSDLRSKENVVKQTDEKLHIQNIQIRSTIKTDWDALSSDQKKEYIQNLITKLKSKK